MLNQSTPLNRFAEVLYSINEVAETSGLAQKYGLGETPISIVLNYYSNGNESLGISRSLAMRKVAELVSLSQNAESYTLRFGDERQKRRIVPAIERFIDSWTRVAIDLDWFNYRANVLSEGSYNAITGIYLAQTPSLTDLDVLNNIISGLDDIISEILSDIQLDNRFKKYSLEILYKLVDSCRHYAFVGLGGIEDVVFVSAARYIKDLKEYEDKPHYSVYTTKIWGAVNNLATVINILSASALIYTHGFQALSP